VAQFPPLSFRGRNIGVQNPQDLRLYQGDIVTVTEKTEHGWWLGSADRDGTIHKGYFPKNYVRAKTSAPAPPPRPSGLTKKIDDVDALATAVKATRVSGRQANTFSIRSLAAFDQLIELGVAVEVTNSSNPSTSTITNGMRVELDCTAMIWDGASTGTIDFSKGRIGFIVGAGQVTLGLDMAVLRLRVGDSATITCNPSMAYGMAGNPPAIPPNVYVVYKVDVLNAVPGDGAGFTGPSEMLANGVSTVTHPAPFKDMNRRNSRIVLDHGARQDAVAAAAGEDA
jgi:hypothetical protein